MIIIITIVTLQKYPHTPIGLAFNVTDRPFVVLSQWPVEPPKGSRHGAGDGGNATSAAKPAWRAADTNGGKYAGGANTSRSPSPPLSLASEPSSHMGSMAISVPTLVILNMYPDDGEGAAAGRGGDSGASELHQQAQPAHGPGPHHQRLHGYGGRLGINQANRAPVGSGSPIPPLPVVGVAGNLTFNISFWIDEREEEGRLRGVGSDAGDHPHRGGGGIGGNEGKGSSDPPKHPGTSVTRSPVLRIHVHSIRWPLHQAFSLVGDVNETYLNNIMEGGWGYTFGVLY